jgi:hypothetical protein
LDSELIGQWLPVGLSGLSLVVASIALGWNIYRDVVLRAKVRVSFAVVSMVTPGVAVHGKKLSISAVNHGPGRVRIEMICGRAGSRRDAILRRLRRFIILNDHTNPMNPRLPAMLDVGESLNLLLPHDEQSVLSSDARLVGVRDSFGREHYASRDDLMRARVAFEADFPQVATRKV